MRPGPAHAERVHPARGDAIRGVALFALAFLLLYNPTLALTGSSLLRPVFALGLLASVLAGSWYAWSRRVFDDGFLMLGSFVACLLAAQSIAFAGGGDLMLFRLAVASVTGFVPVAYFAARLSTGERPALETLFGAVAAAAAVQAVCIMLDWLSPAARGIFSAIVIQPESVQRSFRAAGLSSATGDGLSFAQALGAMSAAYLAVVADRRAARLGWSLATALCLVSMMFVGRTGVVLFAAFALVIAAERSMTAGIVRIGIAVLGAFAAVVGLALLAFPYELLSTFVERVLPHALELFVNLFAGDGVRTASTDDLATMLYFPADARTLWIGAGFYGDPLVPDTNYGGSDIGYVRAIYYVGIVGSAIVYLWFIGAWVRLRTLAQGARQVRFVDALFLVLFAAHVKYPFLLAGATVSYLFALHFCLSFDSDRCASAAS